MPAPRTWVRDFRRISVTACVLLVTLRLFIGWQFLYEGLWKIDTQSSTKPWTSAGFLKNAQGPFRDMFREMTGDPDDMRWLDQQWVEARWDAWAERFKSHYNLNEAQQRRLDEMLNGPTDFRAELKRLPEGVKFPADYDKIVKYDPQLSRIIVDGKMHLSAEEKQKLLDLVKLEERPEGDDENRSNWELGRAYHKAIEDVYKRANQLSFKERLGIAVGSSDPSRVRLVFSNFKGTLGTEAPEKIDFYYQEMLADYNAAKKRADLPFEKQHLERQWQELQELRKELVGPVIALDKQLKTDATMMLSQSQIARGPVAEPWDQQKVVDWLTIVGLTGLGLLLIMGLATRVAAVMGAIMVLSFYLVWPPWPGVMPDPSPEHAFIVNKNLIEVVALLAIAAMPTGQWFGLDSLFYRGWQKLRNRRSGTAKVTPVKEKPAKPVAVKG